MALPGKRAYSFGFARCGPDCLRHEVGNLLPMERHAAVVSGSPKVSLIVRMCDMMALPPQSLPDKESSECVNVFASPRTSRFPFDDTHRTLKCYDKHGRFPNPLLCYMTKHAENRVLSNKHLA